MKYPNDQNRIEGPWHPDLPILEVRELCRTYGSRAKTTLALDHVSLRLMSGEILGIVGESGSGKSTLIRHIACLERPDSGKLLWMGEEYTGKGPVFAGRQMQMIFQDPSGSFDPKMRFAKSLREARRGAEDTGLLNELLTQVGLDASFLPRYPRHVSGGQCQRLSIVRAVYAGAEVLLCDEATSALDVTSQAQIMELLASLKTRYRLSVIFVSHDLAVVSQICDRVMVMRSGRCIESGPCLDVIRHPREEYTKQLLAAARELS